jgi:hypothetical protein
MSARDEEGPSPRSPEGAVRCTESGASGRRKELKPPAKAAQECVDCQVRGGLPTVRGKTRAHYRTGQAGQGMLVIDRRPGERIRINATTEIVILEINSDQVKILVETIPETDAGS